MKPVDTTKYSNGYAAGREKINTLDERSQLAGRFAAAATIAVAKSTLA